MTDNRKRTSSATCVLQPAAYNAVHAYRPPAKQEVSSRVCGSLFALYCYGFNCSFAFCVEHCDLWSWGSLPLCDTCMLPQVQPQHCCCCALPQYSYTSAAAKQLCDSRRQPTARQIHSRYKVWGCIHTIGYLSNLVISYLEQRGRG